MDRINLDNYPTVLEAVRNMDRKSAAFKPTVALRWLRNCTMEAIEPYLRYYLYEESLGCELVFGGYDTIRQDLANALAHPPHGDVSATVLAIFGEQGFFRAAKPDCSLEDLLKSLRDLFEEARNRCSHLIVVNTWIPPFHVNKRPGGAFDDRVRAVNAFVRDYVKSNSDRVALADWERLAATAGEAGTFDYRFLYSAKAPFKHAFLRLLAFETVRTMRPLCGRTKKCLVLDCDDTLWKGILGEDGPGGLQLDPFEYPGNIYYRFQETVLALHSQGVLLCLCSKNEEAEVFDLLETNPNCLIKKRHLAAWRVNWRSKIENIADLAVELNLGLDSFVFVDDSPSECALVREALPAVTVLQVPGRVYELPNLLLHDGYFDSFVATNEDRVRTALYQSESKRKETRTGFVDVEQYLAHLELWAEVREAARDELPRVAQLTQKTNQFNLTTVRHSQLEVEALSQSPDHAIFRLRPGDRYGDYGITGVLIARRIGAEAQIDTLLLSCRILERRLEFVFVAEVLKALGKRWGVQQWRAEYIPTAKNKLAANFWDSLGFTAIETPDGCKIYTASSGAWRIPHRIDFINVVRE